MVGTSFWFAGGVMFPTLVSLSGAALPEALAQMDIVTLTLAKSGLVMPLTIAVYIALTRLAARAWPTVLALPVCATVPTTETTTATAATTAAAGAAAAGAGAETGSNDHKESNNGSSSSSGNSGKKQKKAYSFFRGTRPSPSLVRAGLWVVGILCFQAGWMWVATHFAADANLMEEPMLIEAVMGNDASGGSRPGVVLLLVGVVGPVAEELLCRGMLFARLARVLGVMPAILVSGAVFGAAHYSATLQDAKVWATSFIGIVFGSVYRFVQSSSSADTRSQANERATSPSLRLWCDCQPRLSPRRLICCCVCSCRSLCRLSQTLLAPIGMHVLTNCFVASQKAPLSPLVSQQSLLPSLVDHHATRGTRKEGKKEEKENKEHAPAIWILTASVVCCGCMWLLCCSPMADCSASHRRSGRVLPRTLLR